MQLLSSYIIEDELFTYSLYQAPAHLLHSVYIVHIQNNILIDIIK